MLAFIDASMIALIFTLVVFKFRGLLSIPLCTSYVLTEKIFSFLLGQSTTKTIVHMSFVLLGVLGFVGWGVFYVSSDLSTKMFADVPLPIKIGIIVLVFGSIVYELWSGHRKVQYDMEASQAHEALRKQAMQEQDEAQAQGPEAFEHWKQNRMPELSEALKQSRAKKWQ